MNNVSLEKNKQLYFRSKLNYLAKTIKKSLSLQETNINEIEDEDLQDFIDLYEKQFEAFVEANKSETSFFLINNSYDYAFNDIHELKKNVSGLFYKDDLCVLDSMIFETIENCSYETS